MWSCGGVKDTSAADQVPMRKSLTPAEQARYNGLFLESVRQGLKGNRSAQLELLLAAREVDPTSPQVNYDLAQLYLALSDRKDSTFYATIDSLTEYALRFEPNNTTYQMLNFNRLSMESKWKEAVACYKPIFAASPNIQLLPTLYSLCMLGNCTDDYIYFINQVERVEGVSEQTTMEKYRFYEMQGNDELAYKTLEDLCAQFPDDLSYRVLLGDVFYKNNYKEQALGVYQDVLAAEPLNSFALLSLSNYYRDEQNDSLFQKTLRNLIFSPTTETDMRYSAIVSYYKSLDAHNDSVAVGRLSKALILSPYIDDTMAELVGQELVRNGYLTPDSAYVFDTMLNAVPENNATREVCLYLADQRGDTARVEQLAAEGMALDSTQYIFPAYILNYYMARENYGDALEVAERMLKNIEATAPDTIYLSFVADAAWLAEQTKRPDKKLAFYEKAVERYPTDAMTANNYAYELCIQGADLDKAEELITKSLNQEPHNVYYLDTYAWILYKQKNYEQARIYIDQALLQLESLPDESKTTYYDHAGDIYFRCGLRNEAVAFWQQAIEKTTTKEEISTIKRKIKRRSL